MHVGFRTSGGRGEYEVVGSHSGFNASDLEGWHFSLQWPDGIVRDTGLVLEPATSGKPRLRAESAPRFQIGRLVAAMLMLPEPTRAFKQTPSDDPIARAKKYSLTRIGFSPETEFTNVTDLVTIHPSFVTIENQGLSEHIGVGARYARISTVYAKSALLPASVQQAVKEHQSLLSSGSVIDRSLSRSVERICEGLGQVVSGYIAESDPLPALEALLRIGTPTGPSLPPPDELGEEEPEVSARSAHQYRLARARGASARRFSEEVRSLYHNRCAFCGAKLGGIEGVPVSGIEAAHILAWSRNDLDVVPNGIALCPLHHWAFDAGIMMPVSNKYGYKIRFTNLAYKLDTVTLSLLGTDGADIPVERLPTDTSKHPSRRYLKALYADLGVTFPEQV